MTSEVVAVVGATGKSGSRVLAKLGEMGLEARGLSRSSPIPFDWADRSTWAAALQGVRAAYVTYFPDLAVPAAETGTPATPAPQQTPPPRRHPPSFVSSGFSGFSGKEDGFDSVV